MPRLITKKWIEVHDLSGTAENKYKPMKQIRSKTSKLSSNLCDYSDAYIVVEAAITVEGENNRDRKKSLAFNKIRHHLFLAFQK